MGVWGTDMALRCNQGACVAGGAPAAIGEAEVSRGTGTSSCDIGGAEGFSASAVHLRLSQASQRGLHPHGFLGGFVLLELMLVVAIIGVLASVAMPSYQDYIVRTKVVEALDLGMSAQKAVGDFHDRWGVFPSSNDEAGLPDGGKIQGRYVNAISVLPQGVLLIELKPETLGKEAQKGEPDQARPYQLVVRPAVHTGQALSPVTWVCQFGSQPQGAQIAAMPEAATALMEAKYLPSSCRAG